MTTAGEGGMVTTNAPALHEFMWSYKDHGKSLEKVKIPATSTAFRWIHDSIGTNWRLTEIQAAIGRYQLEQLNDWVAQRQGNGTSLCKSLGSVDGLRVTMPPEHVEHAYYKYYFFIEPQLLATGWSRDRVVAEIHAGGVPCFTGTCPEIYKEQAFADLYGELPRLPVAKELGETSVMLNVHPGITDQHMAETAHVIKQVMARAIR